MSEASNITVRDFIKFLESQDPEAIVECVCDGSVEPIDFDRDVEYVDFRGNQFVRDTDWFKDKRFLRIGSVY